MNKLIYTVAVIMYFLASILAQTFGQEPSRKTKTLTLKDYDINQFISSSDSTPENIMKLDNNREIILACVKGKTREQLQTEGIEFVESQIKLLKTWRILQEDNDTLKTSFPILGENEINRLRNYSAAVVPTISQQLRPDILRFIEALDSIGRADNVYTIFFSYVLDDLVWDRFQEKGLLEERIITAETPFWAGEIWAIYPPRGFSMGTNSISDQGIEFKVNWTKKAIPQMMPFVADWKNFSRLFEDYCKLGRVEDKLAKAVFAPFDLFDNSGQFTVPVIIETENNLLYKISSNISEMVSSAVPNVLDLVELTKTFNFRDNRQTLIIIYHELMWDLMDQWANEGLLKKPFAFTNPEKADPSDIGDLVFIVRTPN